MGDDFGCFSLFCSGLAEFLRVVFNVVEKRGSVFLWLVFALFSS